MKPSRALEILDLLRADMSPVERGEFRRGLIERFGITAGRVAVESTGASGFQAEQVDYLSRGGAGESVLTAISSESWALAEEARATMAERFETAPIDFNTVISEKGKLAELAVAHTALNGLPHGSWNQIFARGKATKYTIELGGKRVDTRKAMSWPRYQAFINAEVQRGASPLPDSEGLNFWTNTWLTGEKADADSARVGCVSGGRPLASWDWRALAGSSHRVRPAVVIAEFDI